MRFNLNARLISWVLVLVFLFLATNGLLLRYYYSQNPKNKKVYKKPSKLSANTDLKVGQIVQWRNEHLGYAEFRNGNLLIAQQVESFMKNLSEVQIRSYPILWIKAAQNSYAYSKVYLCNLKCIFRFTPSSNIVINSITKTPFANSKNLELKRLVCLKLLMY
jgi:hypothetical protein